MRWRCRSSVPFLSFLPWLDFALGFISAATERVVSKNAVANIYCEQRQDMWLSHRGAVGGSSSPAPAFDTKSNSLGSPEPLRSLEIGECMLLVPANNVTIQRIAHVPDMFVLRSFLPTPEELIQRCAAMKMQNAETKSGSTMHRTKSNVVFVPPSDEEIGDVVQFMTAFCCHGFVPEELGDEYDPEHLQVARYTKGGKFDLHHDGHGRVVTVLTYLNGIADTWFPYALIEKAVRKGETEQGKQEVPDMVLEGDGMAVGKIPGQDGIWIVGDETPTVAASNNNHTVRIQAGDAVVFYNYEYSSTFDCPVMNWRGLHAGRPAQSEKWIATNWIASSYCNTPEQYRK